jgi:glycosyltransferase involved in cell wall biosynthesis
MHPTLDILMAVYNNEAYVTHQLQSIIEQTYPHFQIIIRDDQSTDRSFQLIEDFARLHPGKIRLIRGEKNLGARGNFAALMQESTADYIMFSDADDVWLPNKIEETLALMHKNEKIYGKTTPLLIHTDLTVVDKNLCTITPSFWNYSQIDPEHGLFLNRLLVQNVITGCTMLINRPLLELANPIPDPAIMHDWWIGLVASAFGCIDYVQKPTMLYRQHGKNNIGAKDKRSWVACLGQAKFFFQKKGREEIRGRLLRTILQAAEFLHRYGSQLSNEKRGIVRGYASFVRIGPLHKRYLFFKNRYFKNSFTQNAGMFLLL